MANLPVVRGRLSTSGGRAILAARCPLCGREHRYDKGAATDPDVAEIQALGFSEEWLPCQFDLPGNFWRITFGNVRRRRPSPPRGPKEAEGQRADAPPSQPETREQPKGGRGGGRPRKGAERDGHGG